MSLSNQKSLEAESVLVAGVYSNEFDMTNYKTVSLQLNKSGAGTGTAALQWSNDGVVWKAVNTTVEPEASQAFAAGAQSVHLMAQVIGGSRVRVTFTAAVGTVNVVSGKWIGKQH